MELVRRQLLGTRVFVFTEHRGGTRILKRVELIRKYVDDAYGAEFRAPGSRFGDSAQLFLRELRDHAEHFLKSAAGTLTARLTLLGEGGTCEDCDADARADDESRADALFALGAAGGARGRPPARREPPGGQPRRLPQRARSPSLHPTQRASLAGGGAGGAPGGA